MTRLLPGGFGDRLRSGWRDRRATDRPGETATDAAVELDRVSVSLGDVTAVDDVSFAVRSGKFVGLIGPNGAGKTTLLRAIAAAIAPEAGTIRVTGLDVHALSSRSASRRVAVVPQDTAIAFDFAVEEIVRMGRTPYRGRFGNGDRADTETVAAAMDRTDVSQLAERSISEVSTGERQRVLLARAIAQATPVLLLDEPTASLDINHQLRTLELVRDLVGDGTTVIAAIHDLDLAARYCDELVLLDDGRQIATGTPDRVLTRAHLRQVFDANTAVATDPVTGATRTTTLPAPRDETRDGRIHVIGGGEAAASVLAPLDRLGYTLTIGAVARGGATARAAEALGLEAVTVPPFTPVDSSTQADVEELVEAADVTVVADIDLTPGTLPNVAAARASDEVVLVEDRPVGDRNEAGAAGVDRYESLRDRGTVAESETLLETVVERLEEGKAVSAGPTDTAGQPR